MLNAALHAGIIYVVTKIVSGLHDLSQVSENVAKKAEELGTSFNEAKSDIESYKEQIEDLYKTINDENSSITSVTDARKTLMTVQDQLIDKFGNEKETIDLVTSAINGQSEALDTLTQKQWQATKNEFNDSDMWNDFDNWRSGYSDNIDRMVDKMENAWGNITMSTSDYWNNDEYDELIKRLEEAGWEYSSAYETFYKSGSTEDLYEEILDIQTLVGDDMPDNFLNSLTESANALKSTLDSYEGMWDAYILNDRIFTDEGLADSWKEVNDAYAKYQRAVESGDNNLIEEAISGFGTSINEVLNDENVDDSVKDYFKDMYPALYREVEKWEFKTNIIPEFDTTGIKGKTQEDILEMLQTDGIQEGEDIFNSIVDKAIEYGLILDDDTEGIQKVLDLLVEWGILQGEINNNIPQYDNKIIPTISSSIQQIATQLEPQFAQLGEAYNAIFSEDGFNADAVDNSMLEGLRSTFADIEKDLGVTFDTAELEKFFNVLGSGNFTAEQAQTAFNDLATAWFYGTGTLDNLNRTTADSIVQQMEKLGITNALEIVEAQLAQTETAAALATETQADANELLIYADEVVISSIQKKIQGYLTEAGASEAARIATLQMIAAERIFGSTDLNCSEKIQELNKLAGAYLSAAQSARLAAYTKGLEKSGLSSDDVVAKSQEYLDQMSKETLKLDIDVEFPDSSSKSAKEEIDIMAELNSELDAIQAGYEAVKEARETYDKYGKITVDQAQELINTDLRLLATMGDEEAAYYDLADAKLEEMKVQLARNALDTLNSLKTEADAVQYLAMANVHLKNETLSANEALLQLAVTKKQLEGGAMADAANTIWQGYQNAITMIGRVDAGFSLDNEKDDASDEFSKQRRYLEHLQKMGQISNKEFYERLQKLADEYLVGDEHQEERWGVEEEIHEYFESIKKTYDWLENLLDALAKKTSALIDKADKFISWQKKNAMLNRAIKASDKEITNNQSAYSMYMAKANSVGLSNSYIRKIQNGTLKIEELADEELSEKIEEYTEWYNKAQDVLETINNLYEQERDLIRQKLDNVLDYYKDLDSYVSSVTSKLESLISLHDAMGKRSSLSELVQEFAQVSDQLASATSKTTEATKLVTEIDFGESESVKAAMKEDNQKIIDSIQAEIDNLDVTKSGTYTKLLNNIAKTEAQIQKYQDKGWDVKKAKQYAKLQKKLEDYYELQAELDTNATSNTIANYSKIYTAFQKLQDKIDAGKTLTKSQQKKYDSYLAQMEALKDAKDTILSELETQLGLANGNIVDTTEAEKIQQELDSIQFNLENTATYQSLMRSIETAEKKLAALEEKGYENLTKSQKKTYDKLTKQLEDYYKKKQAFDENATAANIAEYNKIYTAWKKLQDKLDAGKNLSDSQWKKYNQYTEQLANFQNIKDELISDLQDQLDEALNPGDKLDVIERTYEESAEGIYNSYQKQIDGIKNAVTETKQYQNLLAKAQKLEQKKDTKGLSTAEQAQLDKYNAELEALRKGGTAENIADYIATWEKWYKLEQKLQKNGKLSDSDSKKYDEYVAQLEAWNKEKQTQIDDLVSQMEDDLAALQKAYTENVAEAESEINDYYANLYNLAKQIAEYNLGALEAQLSLLDSYISYYQQIVSLYDSFSGDKLTKILTDLDIDLQESQEDLYRSYLEKLQEKYDATLSKINEYNELIEAIDTNDFASSMQLFQDAIAQYRANGQTEMADKLQAVLNLLDERAIDADNWDEFADEWLNEWTKALADAKTELVDTAIAIQEINDALREAKFSNITDAIQELSNAQDILSSITNLINDDWVYNEEDGSLTQYGLAKVSLLVEQMQQAQDEASKYAELIESIQSMKDTYASEDSYQQALQEAKMNYLNSLSDAQNYQDSLVAILTGADEAIINSLKEVIEKRKEALQKKKELYEYNKNIQASQKEIDAIKAQIDALESLSGAMDTATKAKLAQLKADLAEKEEALQETKDEHTYNLQIDALDEFIETLSSTMTSAAESVNESFETYIAAIQAALEVYNENKDYLDDWSNSIISTILGMGGTNNGGSVDTGIDTGNTDESEESPDVPQVETGNNDTTSAIETAGVDTQQAINSLHETVQEAINNGLLVRIDPQSFISTADESMFNLLSRHIPNMEDSLRAIQNNISNNQNTSVNLHYDSLLRVDGNIDKDFAQVLPEYLQQACEYTKRDIYNELNRIR